MVYARFVAGVMGAAAMAVAAAALAPPGGPVESASAASSCSAEPFVSEYVEGSGAANKAVELYNGTDAPLLLTGSYSVVLYVNGAAAPTATIPLTGSIDSGGVFVLAAADLVGVDEQQVAAALNFTGDDALELVGPSGVVDRIGDVGIDPGTEWGAASLSTGDNTIRRLSSVSGGRTAPAPDFGAVLPLEWEGFPQNTFDGLGTHLASCADNSGGVVTTTIDAVEAPGPCILLSTENLDYGTLAFSTSQTPRSASSSLDVTNCSTTEAEEFLARGSDATGASATWTLTTLVPSGNTCVGADGGQNRFVHQLSDGIAPALDLANGNQQYQASVAAGAVVTTGTTFHMPCSGSNGAGELMSTTITFTALAVTP